jgi:hypothetical protein
LSPNFVSGPDEGAMLGRTPAHALRVWQGARSSAHELGGRGSVVAWTQPVRDCRVAVVVGAPDRGRGRASTRRARHG